MRVTALLLALLSPAAWAAEESAMNAADVSWMMVATTLVLFMTIPGIALFYLCLAPYIVQSPDRRGL